MSFTVARARAAVKTTKPKRLSRKNGEVAKPQKAKEETNSESMMMNRWIFWRE
jgi:hypothetical protein